MSWRDRARTIIEKVLREAEGKPAKEVTKLLFDAYPFGVRQYHPYKVWLDEIKRQRDPRTYLRKRDDRMRDSRQLVMATSGETPAGAHCMFCLGNGLVWCCSCRSETVCMYCGGSGAYSPVPTQPVHECQRVAAGGAR